ncbi:FKBP-type peptidyl-prolyl cis-trans isomerase [Streptomonospora nanhaiensis]|uniref:FKBP-type peptidyl-prolyl cis-trans isomerase n=1 Tax=Streptomonospora nanhaiensis TaxID=1323731 RepID=UPI001C98F61E|nr:FKBP-type peptidyl-prolyl cis-trans isomerase [Streptomonospora nanhaiensis]MBX9389725.1 FKBP-type peptidyl-prolyl cis-trans isomerase [Streptomonospora nanhaiensis]
MRLRAAALAVPFLAVLFAVSSCSSIPEDWRTPAFLQSEEDDYDSRLPEVSGEVGEEPKVDFSDKAPPQDEQITDVVEQGAGENELVRSTDIIQAEVVEYQWTAEGKAEKTQSTYESGAPILLNLSQLGEELTEGLVNQPVGSRVIYAFPPQDPAEAQAMGQPSPAPGASVSVLDIKERYGEGQVVPGEQTAHGGDGLPTVHQPGHELPDIEIPDSDPPADLETQALIEGDGPEVEEGQQLVVQYTGMRWDDSTVFDSTWNREGAEGVPSTFIIGAGQVIEGWDKGLVGQKVGSRMLLVIPEDMAYGENAEESGSPAGTLVFVVDILDAVDSAPPPEEDGGDGGGDSGGDSEETAEPESE